MEYNIYLPFIILAGSYAVFWVCAKCIANNRKLLNLFISLIGLFGVNKYLARRAIVERYGNSNSGLLGKGYYSDFLIEKVWDGDTVDIDFGFARTRIRLADVDAPEDGQPYKEESTRLLQHLLLK